MVRRVSSKAAPAKGVQSNYRGSAGLARMEEEFKRQEAAKEARKIQTNEPFRFFVPVGGETEIIIADDEPTFFRNEHALMNPRTKRYNLFTPCINESANCPVCTVSEKPAYFAMYLTVIDLTVFVNNQDEEVEWTKKLLVVKPAQQKKIARLLEKHGTLRGMHLRMARDGDKDAAIGNDIEFLGFIEEEEMEEYVSEYTDQDGKVHEILGDEPFDYDKIFPELTEKQLAAVAGITTGSVGNRDDDDRAIGRSRSRRGRDETEEEAPAPRRAARRGKAAEVEEEEAEEPAPRRGRRAAPAEEEEEEPAPRRSSRRGRAVEEEEVEEEEAPAPRRSSRARAPVEDEPAPRRSRRAAPSVEEAEEYFDAEEEEEAPAPRRAASASKRAAIRGRR